MREIRVGDKIIFHTDDKPTVYTIEKFRDGRNNGVLFEYPSGFDGEIQHTWAMSKREINTMIKKKEITIIGSALGPTQRLKKHKL